MDGKKLHSRSPLLTLRVEQSTNGTLVASIIPHKRTHVQVTISVFLFVPVYRFLPATGIALLPYSVRFQSFNKTRRC